MHEQEAAANGIHCLYQLLDLTRGSGGVASELATLLDAAEHVGFAGLNITHPCKQMVMAHLTDVSASARAVGAVNTVLFSHGARVGHNTDWWAFAQSLREGLADAALRRVVQLGAGGAGSATAYAMLDLGVDHLTIIDVVPERAEALSHRLSATFPGRIAAYTDVATALQEADGLIHATPTGMAAHPGMPLPEHLLRPDLWVADVVYFPVDTPLLVAARTRGCRTIDGTGMAIWQAVEAFRLFTSLDANPERMRTNFLQAAQ